MDLSKLTAEERELLARAFDGEDVDMSLVPAERKEILASAWDAYASDDTPAAEAPEPVMPPEGPRGSLLMGTKPTPTPTAGESGDALLQLMDVPGGLVRTAWNAASNDAEGKRMESVSDAFEQFNRGEGFPSTGSMLGDMALDPLTLSGVPGLAKLGAKVGKKIGTSAMRQAMRPAQAKLAKETVGDLGGFLMNKGFKGGTAAQAGKFADNVAQKAIEQRSALVQGLKGSASKLRPEPPKAAIDVIKKAVREGDRDLANRLRNQIRDIRKTPQSLKQLENLKRGVDRRITDASRVGNTRTTLETQFDKALRRDLDKQIVQRMTKSNPQAAATYKALGQDVKMGIKAQKPLRALAEKPAMSAVDMMLIGGGAAGQALAGNPAGLAAFAAKKAWTSPAIMSTLGAAAPTAGRIATPAVGMTVYDQLQQRSSDR